MNLKLKISLIAMLLLLTAIPLIGSEETYEPFNSPEFTLLDTQDDGGIYWGVWSNESYVYTACYEDGIRAYTFNGADFTLLDTQYDGEEYDGVWSDGTYIYTACSGDGIRAYTFNGTDFTLLDTQWDLDGDYWNVWGDGTYLYVGARHGGIQVYTFNGTDFTHITAQDDGGGNEDYVNNVWSDGTYVYAPYYSEGIRAYSFNGTDFTLLDTQDDGGNYWYVWGDGTYIYTACYTEGVRAYTFNGTDFTLLDTQDDGGNYLRLWHNGTYLFVANSGDGIKAYTFNGTDFTLIDSQDDGSGTNDYYLHAYGDGTYIYTACYDDGIRSYLFETPVLNASTNITTDTKEISTVLHGYLTDTSENCTVRFEINNGTANYTTINQTQNIGSFNQTLGLKEYLNENDDGLHTTHGGSMKAQVFTVGHTTTNETFNITKVRMKLSRKRDPGTYLVRIQALDGEGKPDGVTLASGTIPTSIVKDNSSRPQWHEIDLTPSYGLIAGTQYALITSNGQAGGSLMYVQMNSSGTAYTGGYAVSSEDSGNSWTIRTYDLLFEVYGLWENELELQPGSLYHYRAVANNTQNISYGEYKYFLTKPYRPAFLIITPYIGQLNLTWDEGEGHNKTYIERRTEDGPWNITEGTVVFNGTGNQTIDILPLGKYFYQAWSYSNWTYNSTLEQYSFDFDWAQGMLNNTPPNQPTNEFPANNSDYVVPETNMNVTVIDPDEDNMTVEFRWQNGTLITSVVNVTNGSVANIYLPDYIQIEHDTDYSWYVTVDDGTDNITSPVWTFHTSMAWDINGDRIVNYLDASALVSHYGETGDPGWIPADINNDGVVDYLDVSLLISHYGESY